MGLDIHYYSRAVAVPAAEWQSAIDRSDEPEDERYVADENGWLCPYVEPAFPGRADPLTERAYRAVEEGNFRAGSYSGYNWWRKKLAQMVGIDDIMQFWDNPDMSLPFSDLINFSDCEGTIGPTSCKKLSKQFAKWRDRAKAYGGTLGDEGWWENYQAWQGAFDAAKDGGLVELR